ncbi:DUF5677 domain-containing protein [Amycolatopsis sp. NBC_01480]|uniref:DUF5677 domain-containing protein n=1 Tax=Amycolatopsis sp. NBC_01480 TaxID=2903562 RepID=UPI002E2A3918|nr:DUF5677 domain-containing protein [Amycolatopsis sp. NBC_01480]
MKEGKESLEDLYSRLVAEAIDLDASSDQISAALEGATSESADILARSLRQNSQKMLREHRRIRKGFERRLRKRWARALDLYECVYTSCLEVGEKHDQTHRSEAVNNNDVKFEALTLLHARACLVASDVNGLLRTGHAVGAQARWRTLHEIAVISFVLGDNDAELSERFLLHRLVERFKDAERYQKHCEALGYEPFSDSEMTEFSEDRKSVMRQFGSGYQRSWGWAKPLMQPKVDPNFTELEEIAGIEHMRPWVQQSHHAIHSGASGALSIRQPRGKSGVMLVGPSNTGLADPAQSTLGSLVQVTTVYLTQSTPSAPTPEDLISLKAIWILLDEAREAFVEAQTGIDADEERLNSNLS